MAKLIQKTIRLLDTSIPVNKSVIIGLTSIYGMGLTRATLVVNELGWNAFKKVSSLTPKEKMELLKKIDEKKKELGWLIDRDLRRYIEKRISEQVQIGSYKGLRHTMNLPVRGQRTHSNAKTQKMLRRYQSLFGKGKV